MDQTYSKTETEQTRTKRRLNQSIRVRAAIIWGIVFLKKSENVCVDDLERIAVLFFLI